MNRMGEDITFAQLRTFVCAARAGSFVKAGDRLGISQPAVSEQITTLERRLGQVLFRRRRGTTPLLTERGQQILETAETILAASGELFAGKKPAEPSKLPVRICIGPMLRDNYLKPLIPAICRAHPEVEISFSPIVPLADGIVNLAAGDLDLIVFTVPDLPEEMPYVTKICDVPVGLVARAGTGRRLAEGKFALRDLDFLFPTQRTAHSERWAGRLLRNLGLSLQPSAKFLDCGDAILDMVEDGQGVAYVMLESVAERLPNGTLEFLDVPLPPMHRIIAQSPRAAPVVASIGSLVGQALHARTPRFTGFAGEQMAIN